MKDVLDGFLQKYNMPAFGVSFTNTGEEKMTKKVLVVDDDQVIVETLTAALEESNRDYQVISASDGFEAGIQVSHFDPDLLILDIMMPDIDGYEVCRRIKTTERTKHTKIIVLSGYLDEENYKKMQEYGAERCFSKPLPLKELMKEIEELLFSGT